MAEVLVRAVKIERVDDRGDGSHPRKVLRRLVGIVRVVRRVRWLVIAEDARRLFLPATGRALLGVVAAVGE